MPYLEYLPNHALELREVNRDFLRRTAAPIPKTPGRYFWDEWGQVVDVYKKSGMKGLYVTPPTAGAIELKITSRIAGIFVAHKE